MGASRSTIGERLELAARLKIDAGIAARLITNDENQLLFDGADNALERLHVVEKSLKTGGAIRNENNNIKVHNLTDERFLKRLSVWFGFSQPASVSLQEFSMLTSKEKKAYLKNKDADVTFDNLNLSGEGQLLADYSKAKKLLDEEAKQDEEAEPKATTDSKANETTTTMKKLVEEQVAAIHAYQVPEQSGKKQESIWQNFKKIIVPCESKDEFKRFLLLSVLGFLAILAYSLLRVSKDTMILAVTGTEVLPVLKLAVVLPATFAATYIWKLLVDNFGDKAIFVALLIFAGFFTTFFFALPHIGMFHGVSLLSALLPGGFGKAAQYWVYTLFYMMSELWAVVLVDGFLKSLQNATLRKERIKSVLPTASLFQSVGLIASSFITSWAFGLTGFSLASQISIILMILGCTIALFAGAYALAMFTGILKPAKAPGSEKDKAKSQQVKGNLDLENAAYKLMVLGLVNSRLPEDQRVDENILHKKSDGKDIKKTALSNDITHLAWNAKSSGLKTVVSVYRFPLLRNIALCILGYNMTLVLFEIVWKNQVRLYVNAGATALTYGQYMSAFNMWTGIITISLCLLGPVISQIPTKYTNLITPVVLAVLATTFFTLLLFPGFMATLCPFLFATSFQNHLAQIACLGLILNVSVKSTKYSTFEPGISEANGSLPKVIKEAYQSTVNMINGKLGKAAASGIILGLFACGAASISSAAPYIWIILTAIIGVWIYSSIAMSNNVAMQVGKTQQKPLSATGIPNTSTAQQIKISWWEWFIGKQNAPTLSHAKSG